MITRDEYYKKVKEYGRYTPGAEIIKDLGYFTNYHDILIKASIGDKEENDKIFNTILEEAKQDIVTFTELVIVVNRISWEQQYFNIGISNRFSNYYYFLLEEYESIFESFSKEDQDYYFSMTD